MRGAPCPGAASVFGVARGVLTGSLAPGARFAELTAATRRWISARSCAMVAAKAGQYTHADLHGGCAELRRLNRRATGTALPAKEAYGGDISGVGAGA